MTTRLPRLDEAAVEAAIGPLDGFAHQCHAAALALVQSELFGYARVARGACRGVMGQHSWAVLGEDVYDPGVVIVDVTAWSYDPTAPRVWIGRARRMPHRPHGAGSIWQAAKPSSHGGPTIALTPAAPLSPPAAHFLQILGPLDARGWMALGNSPMGGWPAAEIITAMLDTRMAAAYVPIDIAGMLTDRNPGGVYLREPAGSPT